MPGREMEALLACLDLLRGRLQKYRGRALGEQNTKASLIEPLFDALGWDSRDFDDVHREFKAKRADRPVDYALQLSSKPRVFVEAKGLGENLSDRKWVAQILGYATVAGVTWCVLTDGDEYRFYNATAPVDADEKLFCRVRISDDDRELLISVLRLISRSSVEADLLSGYWRAHFVDRYVRRALQRAVDGPDRGIVRLLRREIGDFTDKQIVDSLRRLNMRVETRTTSVEACATDADNVSPPVRRKLKATEKKKPQRTDFGITLQQLVASGFLRPPLKLFRLYKGTMLNAVLNADGTVEFAGQRYDSCSLAAGHARSTLTGRMMHTNGWTFWQYLDADKKKRELTHARKLFLNGAPKS